MAHNTAEERIQNQNPFFAGLARYLEGKERRLEVALTSAPSGFGQDIVEAKLHAVRHASQRLARGEIGCESCTAPIPEWWFLTEPASTVCPDCQEIRGGGCR
jgi:hypothetical protein